MRVLITQYINTTFTRKDYAILSKHYVVSTFYFTPKRKIYTPFFFIKQLLFLLWNINKYDLYLSQFAGYHSLLPNIIAKIKRVPAIMILGGTDCVAFPSIKYGNFQKFLLKDLTKLSFRTASAVAPVHKSLTFSEYTYTLDDYPCQGYKYFVKGVDVRDYEIYNGYDLSELKYDAAVARRANSFLTVTQSIQKPVFYRKGIDLILQIAKLCPHLDFTIVGVDTELDAPANVQLIPPVPYKELIQLYSQHEFYFQLSICEGFPNALCEGMLCGCIPIGSNVAAIPQIIGDAGFVLYKRDVNELFDVVQNAINSDKALLSRRSRSQIENNYPISRRESELIDMCEKELKLLQD